MARFSEDFLSNMFGNIVQNEVNLRSHHIGVAVFAIEDAVPFYLAQGYRKLIRVYDPAQNVEVCVLSHETFPMIELLSPHNSKSPINNILDKVGASPYHICYIVQDLAESVQAMKGNGFMLVTKPKASNAFGDRKVCFLINRKIGLVELMEEISHESV